MYYNVFALNIFREYANFVIIDDRMCINYTQIYRNEMVQIKGLKASDKRRVK